MRTLNMACSFTDRSSYGSSSILSDGFCGPPDDGNVRGSCGFDAPQSMHSPTDSWAVFSHQGSPTTFGSLAQSLQSSYASPIQTEAQNYVALTQEASPFTKTVPPTLHQPRHSILTEALRGTSNPQSPPGRSFGKETDTQECSPVMVARTPESSRHGCSAPEATSRKHRAKIQCVLCSVQRSFEGIHRYKCVPNYRPMVGKANLQADSIYDGPT